MLRRSADFCRLWSQGNVRGKTHEVKTFYHATSVSWCSYNAFDIGSAPIFS